MFKKINSQNQTLIWSTMSIEWINQNHWKVTKDYSYNIVFPFYNPRVNGSSIRVRFSVQVYSKEQHSRTRARSSVSHFGERSSIRMKEEQELEHVTGDSVVMLPLVSESEEEPTLLLLPSRISEDRLGKRKTDFSNMGTWSLCTKLMYCRLC